MKGQPNPVEMLHRESQVRVLRYLWKNRTEWGGREAGRMIGMSHSTCHEALKKLYERGLVGFRNVAHVHLYKYNEDNFLNQKVFGPLFEAERTVPGEMLKLVKRTLTGPSAKAKILSLTIYGSRARGDHGLRSDLDLLIVVPDKTAAKAIEDDINELHEALGTRFSIPLSPYLNTLAELRRKYAKKLSVLMNIVKEGECVYGKKVEELVA